MELQVVLAVVVVCLGVVGCMGGEEGAGRCEAPLVVFGASMVDVGENAVANPGDSAAEFPPYGVDYFHAPAARFSNGRLLIDFISQGLGYGLLDPYLDSVAPNFAHGVNFASSGSTARSSNSSGVFPLDVQVKQFRLFKSKVLRAQSKHHGSLKHLPAASGFAKAIYFIETAHNDYISTILQNSNFDSLSLVLSVISAMESAIRELHSDGARNIIVMNVIPLGCTPGFLAISLAGSLKMDNDSCIAFYNSLVDLHNSHLQQRIVQLRGELSMNSLVMFDAYAVYLDAIRHPSKYGVMYPFMACCGAGGGKYNVDLQVPCGKKGMVNGTLVEAGRCRNPTQYISWDGLHPTETFAKHLALGVLSGNFLRPSLSIPTICNS